VHTRSGSWAACAARRWRCGGTVGELNVSPGGLSSSTCCPALPSLQWGLWASVPHLPRYSAPLRLPHCPSQVASLVARFPIPCPLRFVRAIPYGLVLWAKPPDHARAFGHPVPQSGHVTRRHVALPSSRATPVYACPALRPRWCPPCSPKRLQDCCLPATGNRRLSPPYTLEGYPLVHDYTHFGAPSRGLHPCSLQLRPSIAGCARGVRY